MLASKKKNSKVDGSKNCKIFHNLAFQMRKMIRNLEAEINEMKTGAKRKQQEVFILFITVGFTLLLTKEKQLW